MDTKKIGLFIAKLRKEKNLTQNELGIMVGVSNKAVPKWECGITMPDVALLILLGEALGVTAQEILKGELEEKNFDDISISMPKKNFLYAILIIITVCLILILLALLCLFFIIMFKI